MTSLLDTSDFEATYQAVASRDPRWDGRVFVGVTSTGIYCRPVCPVPMPRREVVRFYRSAAQAQGAGFRACRRCRPEQSPDSPDWDIEGHLVTRAMDLIAAGVVDEEGVPGLARRLAVSPRHLDRVFRRAVGVGPADMARASRTAHAKQLLEGTGLTSTDVAFAAGFGSLRAYNESMRRAFGRSPTEIRAGRRGPMPGPGVRLRLAYRPPYPLDDVVAFHAARAIPGVEAADAGAFRRVIATADGPRALVVHRVEGDALELAIDGIGPREVAPLVRRVRRAFDLDADPVAIDAALADDPIVGPSVRAIPGRRLPAGFDPWSTLLLAVCAQGVSLATARRTMGRIAARHGTRAPDGSCLFPDAARLADADLRGLGLTAARATLAGRLAREVADGSIDLELGDPDATRDALGAIPGIGPWTLGYVALRIHHDPDGWLPGDAAVRAAFRRRGLPADDRSIARAAEGWRPWRGYALMHLWASA